MSSFSEVSSRARPERETRYGRTTEVYEELESREDQETEKKKINFDVVVAGVVLVSAGERRYDETECLTNIELAQHRIFESLNKHRNSSDMVSLLCVEKNRSLPYTESLL